MAAKQEPDPAPKSSASWRERLSIRWILPAAVVLPVFAVAVVLTLLAYKTEQRTASDLAGENMRQIHKRIENHLDHLMDLPPAINALNVTRLREGGLSLTEPARDRDAMFQTLGTFPDVSSIVLASASSQVTWVIRYPGETAYEYALKTTPTAKMEEFPMSADGKISIQSLRSYDYNPVPRPWYRAAVEAGGPTWGDVYVWIRGGKGETLGLSYVEPYRDGKGAIVGVVSCELTLADISVFLKKLEIGKTGEAFIVDREGNLIANSLGISCMKNDTGRLPAIEASGGRIAAAAREIEPHIGPLKAITGLQRAQVTLNNEPAQLVASSFRNRRNLDWLIVTVVPDSDFLADAQRARWQNALIAAVAVLAALALGTLIALWLLRPILAVVTHAQRVGGGDLDARLERHDNREISQIANALNEMADGLKDRLRLRHALSLAMEVQQSLLPNAQPIVRGADVASRAKYCDETGGDYYDFLDVEGMGPHTLFIALGDVMGHGIAAAMLMATARGILRSHVRVPGSLGDLLTHVNQLLVPDTRGKRFMTMFLGIVDTTAGTVRWASAGHDQPMVYDPETKSVVDMDEGGNLPLGIDDAEKYEEKTYTGLRPGQVMLLGTDGLWEAKNESSELFGKERVCEAMVVLAHLSAAEIEAGIFRRLKEFCGTRDNEDDITYVVIKFSG